MVEIEVMDGNGVLHRFNNPKYEHYKPDGVEPGFEAVGVSMGLMGVITKVIILPVPLYWLRGLERTVKQDDADSVVRRLEEGKPEFSWKAACEDIPYMRINYFAAPKTGHLEKLRHVTQWTAQREVAPAPGTKSIPYKSIQRYRMVRFFAILGMKIGLIFPNTRNFLLRLFCQLDKPGEGNNFYDAYWKALPMDNDAGEDFGFRVDFSEIWIPQRLANEALQNLREAWDKDALMPGNFVTEIYSSKKSPFWLAMSHAEEMM